MKGTKLFVIALALAAGMARADAAADFNAALAIYNTGKLEEALSAFEQIAGYAPARLYAGHCLHRLRRSPEAQAAYESARPLVANPETPAQFTSALSVEVAIGRVLNTQRKFAQAEKVLQDALSAFPQASAAARATAYEVLLNSLANQRKFAELNRAAVSLILADAERGGEVTPRAVKAYDTIRPQLFTAQEHADAFGSILRAWSAFEYESNRQFLGRVKTEYLKNVQ